MFSATNLLTGADGVWNYIQDNLILFIIALVCLLAIIVIIVALTVASKKAKKKQAEAEKAAEAAAPDEETGTEQPAAVKAEEAEEATPAAPVTEAEKPAATETETPAAEQPAAETPAESESATALAVRPPAALQKVESDAAAAETNDAQAPAEEAPDAAESEEAECVVDIPAAAETDVETDTEEAAPAVFPPEENAPEAGGNAYAGKWEVSKLVVADAAGTEKDSAFFFRLKASNGEPLITSEEYTTLRGAQQGIDTFKSNIARGNFKISITRKGKFIVKLLTNQGNLLAQGEKYATRSQAMSAVSSIKRFAETAVTDEEVQTVTVPYRESAEAEERDYDPTKKGKWVIHKIVMEAENDASYCFDLCASNGQVLFTSEEYSTVASLKNGIRTHKKNIANGNIRAAVTRNGDYIFKIFNGNGQLLCLGGHYKTKQLCLNAIESVKRFSESARLDLDKLFPDEK